MSEKKATVITGFVEINEKISEAIKKTATSSAVDKVVAKRLEAEVTRRADLLEKSLDKYNTSVNALKAIQPDVITFGVITDGKDDETGTALQNKAYSANKWKEKQNLGKLVADLDVALMRVFSDKAEEISKGYADLQKLCGNGGGDKKEKTE